MLAAKADARQSRPIATRSDRRRQAMRIAVVCGVVACHALAVLVMNWEIHGHANAPAGQADGSGQMILASLVAPEHQARHAQKSAKKAPAKTTPVSAANAPPATADSHDAADPSTDPDNGDDAVPQLSAEDSAALDQFDAASAQGSPDAPCALTGSLGAAFSQSPVVRTGIAELPAADRSVANAVMLWDGHWAGNTRTGGRALLRAVLTKALSVARPDCLTQTNRGPALFMVDDAGSTVVVAVGSGQWHWGDLIAPSGNEGQFLAGNYQLGNYLASATSGPAIAP